MKRMSGLKLLDEREGSRTPAKKGDRVVYNMRLFLNKGDEVLFKPAPGYRDKGVPDLISADAVLIVEIRLRETIQKRKVHAS